jgi:ATP-dependent RNA helicase DDX19/DBP5
MTKEEKEGEEEERKIKEALLFRSEVIIDGKDSPYKSELSFEELIIPEDDPKELIHEHMEIYDKLIDKGFENPSTIQGLAIPLIVKPVNGEYRSLVAQAQNGSGKTLAFVLATLLRVKKGKRIQCIIIVPTVELVIQTGEYFEILKPDWFKFTPVTSNYDIDFYDLGQVAIFTPGILFQNYKAIPGIKELKMFVIDECDEVVQNKSYNRQLIDFSETVKDAQFLLFSATTKPELDKYKERFLKNKTEISLPIKKVMNKTNQHFSIQVKNNGEKLDIIEKIFDYLVNNQTFIFVNTKDDVRKMIKILKNKDFSVEAVTGDNRKEDRIRIVKDFKDQRIKVLITTDLLARGIDIPTAKVVINYDVPYEYNIETYLHRQGRVGRFGRNGKVITLLVKEEDKKFMERIVKEYEPDQYFEIKAGDIKKYFE